MFQWSMAVLIFFIFNSMVCAGKIDKVLVQTANTINQNVPMLVDRDTRLDRTSAGAGRNFKYIYTMINLNKKNANIEAFRKQAIPNAKNIYCTSTEMKAFRKYGVTVSHSYFDKYGNELIIFTIRPSDC